MTEEKRESLKEANEILDYHINTMLNSYDDAEDWDVEKAIYTLRDTIKELQKENEEKHCKILNLAEENTRLHKEINERVKLKIENEKIVDEEFIYKDKIREIFETYKDNGDKRILLEIRDLLEDGE